jgi:hypothetical protein
MLQKIKEIQSDNLDGPTMLLKTPDLIFLGHDMHEKKAAYLKSWFRAGIIVGPIRRVFEAKNWEVTPRLGGVTVLRRSRRGRLTFVAASINIGVN